MPGYPSGEYLRKNTSKSETDPILYVERLEDKLTEFIHANGDYLFAVFAFCCLIAITLAPVEPAQIATSSTYFGSNASNYRNYGISSFVNSSVLCL